MGLCGGERWFKYVKCLGGVFARSNLPSKIILYIIEYPGTTAWEMVFGRLKQFWQNMYAKKSQIFVKILFVK